MAKRYGKKELPKLQVRCTSTSCENGLHCFKPTPQMRRMKQKGVCRECGLRLDNFSEISKLQLKDTDFIINSLQHETWRHYFWYHIDLDQWAINYAYRKGKTNLKIAIQERLKHYLKPDNDFDGRQTPLQKNPIYYGQHATATCCRKCIEYWYNVPLNRELKTNEIDFFSNLIMVYILEKVPDLPDVGKYVPPIRS